MKIRNQMNKQYTTISLYVIFTFIVIFAITKVGDNAPRILGTARLAIFVYSFISIIHAVRGRVEGLAALRKCPSAIMSGQVAYTVALLVTLAVMLPLGVPGWTMAVAAIFVAPAVATAAMYVALSLRARAARPADVT